MGVFASKPTYNPDTDIPNLKGKVALVTGGNGGLGYATVAELVKHGATVYMGARNESRATGAIAKLKADGYMDGPNSGKVLWLELDQETPKQAKRAAEEFMRRESRLDILVNNACINPFSASSFQLVEDSKIPIGRVMSTNHLGTFALTTALLPLIQKTAEEPGSDVRIITVSSETHTHASLDDLKNTDGWNFKFNGFVGSIHALGVSKLANILFAKQLQRLLDDGGIDVVSLSLHPGALDSEGSQEMSKSFWIGFVIRFVLKLTGKLLTPAKAAYTPLFAATSLQVRADKRKYAGVFLTPVERITEPSKVATDMNAAKELWETTERVISEM
ncbi:hypothetical protein FRB96_004808 [Tulasnella sp. 330]|nr:hypothetical protein FRB96_004808 [Tulasnella sp. 330]KAG8877462.1 hypothetical protein FRB97_003393 [Tulasnella sp. 331]KAG8883322.1 hypothetical protein FRB98_003168 [Tulasnella sp. 332]